MGQAPNFGAFSSAKKADEKDEQKRHNGQPTVPELPDENMDKQPVADVAEDFASQEANGLKDQDGGGTLPEEAEAARGDGSDEDKAPDEAEDEDREEEEDDNLGNEDYEDNGEEEYHSLGGDQEEDRELEEDEVREKNDLKREAEEPVEAEIPAKKAASEGFGDQEPDAPNEEGLGDESADDRPVGA